MARRTAAVGALGVIGAIAIGFLVLVGAAGAGKKDDGNRMHGFFEVPAVSSPTARGTIDVRIRNSNRIDYTLTYAGLSGPPAAAHIHLGQKDVNGGVVAFLCGGGGKPPCPPSSPTTGTVTVTGTIVAADIQPVPTQGIAGPTDFGEVLIAIRAGVTYANVHTSQFPGGEIRGQIKARGGDGDDDDDDD